MKIVSRSRLRRITWLTSVLAAVSLVAVLPVKVHLGSLSFDENQAQACPSGGSGGDDGGGDDGGGDDGGGDDGGGDDGGGDDGGGDDGGGSAGADAGDSGGDDGGGRDVDSAASGSTDFAFSDPLPTIGDPRSIPTMFVVYFDWDSDKLDESAQLILSETEAAVGKLGGARISVIGNTDRSGPSSYNEGLAERRAKAVADALAERGLPAKVVGRKAYGESRPLIKTEDGVRKRLNRRVEIIVEGGTQTASQ